VSAKITIAIDAMGGDHAPKMVLKGANKALNRFPQVEFLLFGSEPEIAPLLAKMPRLAQRCTVHHTDEVITGDAKPSQALRTGKKSSMWLAIDSVAQGQADGVVSAGNTGALMVMSKFMLRMIPGIDRPAIASLIPTIRGESVMLDLGANIECSAENLVQFAVMGDAFARTVLGLVQPSVGLLNVGSEELKGNDAVRAAAQRLREEGSPVRFHGFVEGNDIGAGAVDVVVTDGFTGNVALKTAEGTAKFFAELLRASFSHSIRAQIGYLFAAAALKKFKQRVDPRRYNGAVFLGLNGIAVKSHGGTDALGFANAIGVAVDMKVNGIIDQIRQELSHMGPVPDPSKPKTAAL